MKSRLLLIFLLLLAGLGSVPAAGINAAFSDSRPAKLEQVAAVLSEQRTAFGPPIANRAAWEALARAAAGRAAIRQAESILKSPMPEGTDDVYMALHREYSSATRSRWDKLTQRRRDRIRWLTEAECLENKGRFIPALEATIRSLCAEKAWVFPNYDKNLGAYKQTAITIDLFSSALAWDLATADHLLGEALSPAVRQLIRQELRRRIFDPFERMIAGKQAPHWLNYHNNWLSVCLAGVTGSALALLESREERAVYVKAALDHSWKFLDGYTEDGYCSEGVGYWNYGFGHYVLLAGIIAKATDGRIDLLARKQVAAGAAYGARIELAPGITPAFADCDPGAVPDRQLMNYLNRRLGFGLRLAQVDKRSNKYLFRDLFYWFEAPGAPENPEAHPPLQPELRSWFDQAGVLIGRPAPGSGGRLAVALKGGHNAEQHNHNDLGSYVVLAGGRTVLLDPGQEVRTGRTFSAQRYESKLTNSFGHPVPLVAGTLQQPGKQARAVTLKTDFSDARDTYVMDLKSAYPVPALQNLTRTFVYERTGAGSLIVQDEADFSTPQTFETALITLGKWRQTGPRTLRVEDGDAAVDVEVETGGEPVAFKAEALNEAHRTSTPPTRIAIRLERPVSKACIKVKITPASQ